MTVWGKCEMESFDDDPSRVDDCQVKIEGEVIVVSYRDERGYVTYQGLEVDSGHYVLSCPEREGSATLHRLPNGDRLDGFWTEKGERGMWRLTLNDET